MNTHARLLVSAAILSAVATTQVHAAAILQYQWEFDQTGATAPSTVPGSPNAVNLTLSGTATRGTGVSGETGDYAYDNSAASAMGATSTGIAKATNFTSSLGATSQYTMSAWVKPTSAWNAGFGRIFFFGPNGTTDSGATNSIALLTANTENVTTNGGSNIAASALQLNVAGGQRSLALPAAILAAANNNEWIFLAVSYDDTNSQAKFYFGTTTLAVTETVVNVDLAAVDLNGAGTTSSAFVGNRDNTQRAFDGRIDDVRLYTGLFDSINDVDAVRQSALPAVVPEPMSLTLLGLGAAGLLLRRRR